LILKSKIFSWGGEAGIAANSIDAMTDVKGKAPEEIIKKWNRLEINRKR